MNRTVLVVGAIVAVVGAGLIIMRYDMEVVEASGYPFAYVLDRWTGNIYYVTPNGQFPVARQTRPLKSPN